MHQGLVSMKTIIRIQRHGNYAVIPNATLRDKRLSFRARGLLGMILSNADEWVVHQEWLAEQAPEGRDAIGTAFRELERYGYAVFTQTTDERNRFVGSCWTFHDTPTDERDRTNRTHWRQRLEENQQKDATDALGLRALENPIIGEPAAKKEHKEEQKEHNKKPHVASKFDSDFELTLEPSEPAKPKRKTPKVPTLDIALEIPIPTILLTPAFKAAWADWLSHKYQAGERLTRRGIERQLATLAEWGESAAIESINCSIRNEWSGLFAPKTNTKTKDNNDSTKTNHATGGFNRLNSNGTNPVNQY